MRFSNRKIPRISPYRLAKDHLRRHILSPCKTGYKLPSTGFLAAEFGVSVPTIRKALAELVDEGLLEAAKGSGYFVTSQGARCAPVALLYDIDLGKFPNANISALNILECQSALDRLGRESRVYLGRKPHGEKSTRLDALALLTDLEAGRLAGVIDLSGRPSAKLQALVAQRSVPLLGVGRDYTRGIRLSFEDFFRKALDVAFARGRRKVAFCAMKYLHSDRNRDSQEVKRILSEAGIDVPKDWIREDWHNSWSGGGWDSFRRLWQASEEKPDALVLGSPAFRHEIQVAMNDFGIRHPDDLLVISAATRGDPLNTHFPWPRIEADYAAKADILCGMMDNLLEGRTVDTRMRAVDVWTIHDPSATYMNDTDAENINPTPTDSQPNKPVEDGQ